MMKITKVSTLPEQIEPDSLYLVEVEGSEDLFDLYVTNKEGTAIRHIATKSEVLASTLLYGDTAPSLPNPVPLWFNSAEGTLYIQYGEGETAVWVEAMPSIAVPDFAGTGVANTMARSDHHHDETYVKILTPDW